MSNIANDLEKGLQQAACSAVDQGRVSSSAPSLALPDLLSSSSPDLSPPQVATPPPHGALESHFKQQQESQQQLPTPGYPQQATSAILEATAQEAQDSYLHPADKLWSLYLKGADAEDEHLAESWKGDTDGILIFTGLFAATVATFVTQTCQLLIPSSSDTNAAISLQISQQLAGLSNGTSVSAYIVPPFEAPFYAIWVNTLWLLSLFLSLTGALMATLMQQWTRRYLRGIRYRSVPHIRGPMRLALQQGVKKYRMKQAVALITSLLHASVFIFFAGLVGFAFSLNPIVANVLAASVSALLAVYLSLSVLPILSTIAPYDTVLTPAFEASLHLCCFLAASAYRQAQNILLSIWHLGQKRRLREREGAEDAKEQHSQSREHNLMQAALKDNYLTVPRATCVLDQILTNADELHEVESFLDSIAVLLSEAISRKIWFGGRFYHRSLIDSQALGNAFRRYLSTGKLNSLVWSCGDSSSNGAPLSTRLKRLRTVVKFTSYGRMRKIPLDTVEFSHLLSRVHEIQPELLHSLSRDPDPSVAFPSRLTIIGQFRSWSAANEDDLRYFHTHVQRAADIWYTQSRRTNTAPQVAVDLAVELLCTIIEFTTLHHHHANDLTTVYRPDWEPLFDRVKGSAIMALKWNRFWSKELTDLITEPIPHELLKVAELNTRIPRKYLLLDWHLGEVQRKAYHLFSDYPYLVDGLREIAEAASPIPLYAPPPLPLLGVGASKRSSNDSDSRRRRRALANFPMKDGLAYVLFGPLTWHDRYPDRLGAEYLCLMRSWCFPRSEYHGRQQSEFSVSASDVVDDACQLLGRRWVGEGYAMICLKDKEKARWFADSWTTKPLPAYRAVTADFIDNSESGASVDGKQDVAHAKLQIGEKGGVQSGGETDESDHDDDEEGRPSGECSR